MGFMAERVQDGHLAKAAASSKEPGVVDAVKASSSSPRKITKNPQKIFSLDPQVRLVKFSLRSHTLMQRILAKYNNKIFKAKILFRMVSKTRL